MYEISISYTTAPVLYTLKLTTQKATDNEQKFAPINTLTMVNYLLKFVLLVMYLSRVQQYVWVMSDESSELTSFSDT